MSKGTAIEYSPEMILFLSENRELPRSEATVLFNARFKTDLSINNIAGVCKRKKFFTGRDGCFKKGCTSWNKGKTGFMGANKTSFPSGNIPHNHVCVGTEHSRGDGYIYVKIAEPNTWQLKQRKIYIETHGEIDKDDVVRFRDGDKQNLHPDNLKLFSRYENLYLNKTNHNSLPGEMKLTNELIAQLEGKLYKQ